jgi:hypothetical protein
MAKPTLCRCGHTGDAENTEHQDTFQPGHGRCKICECIKFTWTGKEPALRPKPTSGQVKDNPCA